MYSLPLIVTDQAAKDRPSQATPSRRRGVLLINLGTPERPDVSAVRRYLAEFLSDPEVIRLPTGLGWLNGAIGRIIAHFHAPSSARMYRTIWTAKGSPLREITEDQVEALESALPGGWRVFYATRYGRPAIGETVRRIAACGVHELIVVPMYPQFSGPTTRTALSMLYRHLEHHNQQIQVTTRPVWHNDAGYVHAQAALVEQFAESNDLRPNDTHLLFSAHGLPESYVKRGDPYPELVRETVDLVAGRLGWATDRYSLAYQSRFGPMPWISPFTDKVLRRLAAAGEKRVLVCPISFTADCLETREEIGVRYRALFAEAGGELYLCPALNTFGPFITALKELVLRGPRPVISWSGPVRSPTLLKPTRTNRDSRIENLVMIGASTRGRVGSGRGPRLAYSDPDSLRRAKRSQCEVPDLLRVICSDVDIREAWMFNTCKRFEFYGMIDDPTDVEQRDRIVARVRRHLFGDAEPAGLAVNVLFGGDCLHHLLRTAAGLNSGLPGERDVMDQLQAAHRLAHCAGTVGSPAARLLDEVLASEQHLRSQTEWGRFDPDYCYTAMRRTIERTGLDLSQCRAVVIGGSTTSASVLRSLVERFEVPSRQLTLVYRGHKKGGQLKLLRKAIGNGRRIRVQSYSEPSVIGAIAEADVVFLGVDRQQPVLYGGQLRGCRDFVTRTLEVIDFNVFGSTSGLEALEGVRVYSADRLDAEVSAFADEMCAGEPFRRALEVAETCICDRVKAAVAKFRCAGRFAARASTGRMASTPAPVEEEVAV